MKKTLMFLAILLTLTLAACGGGEVEITDEQVTVADEQVSVSGEVSSVSPELLMQPLTVPHEWIYDEDIFDNHLYYLCYDYGDADEFRPHMQAM
jgi:predicted small lipoprotein YifL